MWLHAAVGFALGVALICGVFWLAFRRAPERREDGGLKLDGNAHYTSNHADDWGSGSHDSGSHN